jgi:neutral trehalase
MDNATAAKHRFVRHLQGDLKESPMFIMVKINIGFRKMEQWEYPNGYSPAQPLEVIALK